MFGQLTAWRKIGVKQDFYSSIELKFCILVLISSYPGLLMTGELTDSCPFASF